MSQQDNVGQLQPFQDIIEVLCETLNRVTMIHLLRVTIAAHLKSDAAISLTQTLDLMEKLIAASDQL